MCHRLKVTSLKFNVDFLNKTKPNNDGIPHENETIFVYK